jgi:DNA-binding NtrC family response regulator
MKKLAKVLPLAAGMDMAGRKVLEALGGIAVPMNDVLRAVKWVYVEQALKAHDFNYCATARALGWHRNTFARNIDELGMREHVEQMIAERKGRG